jgi:hypothetical protein
LVGEISDRFRISITPRTVAFQRQMMGVHYQPPRHTQELKQRHIEARVEFCQKMLANPGWLPLIRFSDESRFVPGTTNAGSGIAEARRTNRRCIQLEGSLHRS